MNLPGFTAEVSTYRSTRSYATAASGLPQISPSGVFSCLFMSAGTLARNSCYGDCMTNCLDCDRSRPGCPLPSECGVGCRCRCYGDCTPPGSGGGGPIMDSCGTAMTWCILGCALGAIFGANPVLCILSCDVRYVLCEKYGIG